VDWDQFVNPLGPREPGYAQEEARLAGLFRTALAEANHVPLDHPKFHQAYDLAYDLGHADGVHGIAGHFAALAVLLQDGQAQGRG
jgi:hypothetical protein